MVISLNDVFMNQIAPSAGVLDVAEKALSVKTVTAQRPFHDGQILLHKYKTVKVITLTFDLFTNPIQRKAEFDRILAWASQENAKLVINDQSCFESRYMIVTCTKYPEYHYFDATKPLTLEFTAFDPFKYAPMPEVLELNTAASQKKVTTFAVYGSAPDTPLSFTITNTGTVAMNTARIELNDEFIAFEGLSLPVGGVLDVRFDAFGIMHILKDGLSVGGCRTAESSDELILPQNRSVEIFVTTSTKATVVLQARGRYL